MVVEGVSSLTDVWSESADQTLDLRSVHFHVPSNLVVRPADAPSQANREPCGCRPFVRLVL